MRPKPSTSKAPVNILTLQYKNIYMDPVWFAQYHSDSICVQLLSYFQCLAPASSFLEHRAMTQPKVLSYNIKFLSKVISNTMSPQSYITTAHQLWLHIVKMRL